MKLLSSTKTSERPQSLEADVEARYHFAAKYCRDKEVLDIGTGIGLGAKYLLRQGAKSVHGVDYSKESIKLASENLLPNESYSAMEAINIGKLQKRFDVIVAFEIIEHLPVGSVSELFRVIIGCLKKDGILLTSTPNGDNSTLINGKLYNPYHVKEYTKQELGLILKKFFDKSTIYGISCQNKQYFSKQFELNKSMLYRFFVYVGQSRLVRELIALVPRKLKRFITRENTLPVLTWRDFKISLSTENSPGLIVISRGKKR